MKNRPQVRCGEAHQPTSSDRPRRVFGWAGAIIYLLLVTLACYGPALLPGHTFLPADLVLLIPPWSRHAREIAPGWHAAARPVWDPLFQFYPARKYLADSIHAGAVPWHNPHAFAGTPFIADGQSAFFYPINWLFAILPLASAFGMVAALHTFLAGLFFTLFARQKGIGWEGALAGATAWMLCGTMTAWQMWQVVDAALCWTTLGLFFVDRIVAEPPSPRERRDKMANSAGLGICCGLMLLAGHMQFAFYGLLVIGLYGLFLAGRAKRWEQLLSVVSGLAVGAGIAAAQILPTLDLLAHSLRGNYSLSVLLQTALPPAQLASLVMPEIAGGERQWMTFPYSGAVNYYETACYVGAAALLFACLGFLPREKSSRSEAWFWTGIAALGLLIGCGTSLYDALYYGVPLFKSFHGVARALVLTELAVAILCARGIQAAIDESGGVLRPTLLKITGGAALVTLALYGLIASRSAGELPQQLTHEWFGYGLAQLGIAIVFIVLAGVWAAFARGGTRWTAVAVVALDMLLFASGLNPGADSAALYPPMANLQLAKTTAGDGRVLALGDQRRDLDRMIPNSAMSVGLSDISGSDPLLLADYDRFIAAMNTATTGKSSPNGEGIVAQPQQNALSALDVRAVISPVPINMPGLTPVGGDDVGVLRNDGAGGLACRVYTWYPEAAGKGLTDLLNWTAGSAVGLSDIPDGFTPTTSTCHGDGTGLQATRSDQAVRASDDAALAHLLVFSEVADPAWKATVDGHPASWATADGLLLAVPVPAGNHTVALAYRPSTGLFGLYVSCVAWLAVSFLTASSQIGRLRRSL